MRGFEPTISIIRVCCKTSCSIYFQTFLFKPAEFRAADPDLWRPGNPNAARFRKYRGCEQTVGKTGIQHGRSFNRRLFVQNKFVSLSGYERNGRKNSECF
jgi:hypothetical protein